ncbi:MAG: hypothetical protein NT004_18980 [Bacteroidetes bacterium]|nr:hypothetical protein [Bacteroidota bacterium]
MRSKTVAVIVAHPDDETLWTGGTILSHPKWQWFIVCLTRSLDTDRSLKFHRVLNIFKAEGIMGNLDDEPDQKPMDEQEVESRILELLPARHYDLLISHNPTGEYTRHLRHEETGTAVIKPPGGLATQGDLLYRGLLEMGIDAHAVHFESAQEKEWYYRWFEPDVVVETEKPDTARLYPFAGFTLPRLLLPEDIHLPGKSWWRSHT